MFIKRSSTHRVERGDTIVEVLIAIAVISLVLGGAYVVSNTSLRATRAAQERSNALKLGEAQIEQLKALAAGANGPTAFSGPASFCVVAGAVVDTTDPINGRMCIQNTSGATAPTNTQPRFSLAITRVTVATVTTFTLKESWTDVNGRNTDRLQLIYRVYQ